MVTAEAKEEGKERVLEGCLSTHGAPSKVLRGV